MRKLEPSSQRWKAPYAAADADPILRARAVLDRLEERPEVSTLVALNEWVNVAEAMLDRLEAGEQDR